ncbi:hypothetical protein TGAM01_v209802 [Trichoderma gamsii]|uniref:Uncharacterized protein n=1 Tax=Trichoderma gamsii TaxID=398673 RepID=A0A2P4ZAU2_9HYPO|nr:hypothetical protein TGAM01_v209802 [Trichoderma gamsii]PON21351.1 hypothetical protein TGAM01_v209802 [Trichoderma gamsii]
MILAEPRAFPVGLCWIQGLPYMDRMAGSKTSHQLRSGSVVLLWS